MATPFPDSLEGLGYAFNDEGQLRKINPGTLQPGNEPFEFNISDDRSYNQKHYEALGEVLTEHIYKLLETTCGLEKLVLPKDGSPEGSSFIFASPDALTNPDKLLILIHGSGVVRAGQWARSLVINDSLKSGTQIPVIEQARKLGYGVLVLNSNDNDRNFQSITESGSPEEHAATAWKNYVQSAAAKHVAIMAHSYGGVVTLSLARRFLPEFQARVFAIAFTDSVHYFGKTDDSERVLEFLQKIGRNWVASNKPLDTPIIRGHRDSPDIPSVSAGHVEHTMTSYSSHESVFKFIELQYKNMACRHPEGQQDNTCSAESDVGSACKVPEAPGDEQQNIDREKETKKTQNIS